MDRAERICRAHLYVRSSHLKRYRVRRSRYEIPCNTHIVYLVGELLTDLVEIKKRSAQSDGGGYILLRQLPWIVTKQVFVDNAWQACPLVPLNVTTLHHETGRHMKMHDLLTKLGATAIINGD
jgi:hypothetical protein